MKMKLVVMIPAYNEEKTIAQVIREVPRQINGVGQIRVLIIDDGSLDATKQIAQKAGADKIISHKQNFGLARAFQVGLDAALCMGADVIVNIDGDFQYNPKEIPKIIKPILNNRADIVLTDRRIFTLDWMPSSKKVGNAVATFITRMVSGFSVKDAQSGFRAFSREAALKLNVLGAYTYVQEVIIQAANKNLKMVQMPCEFRKREGKSRLISNLWVYAKRAGSILIRSWIRYKPLKVFLYIGSLLFVAGFLVGLRFLYFFFFGVASGHIQSLILSTILTVVGFQIIVMALVADTIDSNRRINEELLYRIKKREYKKR